MKSNRLAFVLMLWMIASGAFAQQGGEKRESENRVDFTAGPGIEIGKELPEIKLKNQDDAEIDIRELLKSNKGVALVFYRSADW